MIYQSSCLNTTPSTLHMTGCKFLKHHSDIILEQSLEPGGGGADVSSATAASMVSSTGTGSGSMIAEVGEKTQSRRINTEMKCSAPSATQTPDCHQLRRSFSRCIHRLHHLLLNLVGRRLGSGRLTARSLRVPSTLDLTIIRRVLGTKLMKERCMLKCCVAGSYQENRNSSVPLTSRRFESETAHREHFQKRVGSHCRLTFAVAHLSKLEVVTQ